MSSRKKSRPNPSPASGSAASLVSAVLPSSLAATVGAAESRSEPNLAAGIRRSQESARSVTASETSKGKGSQLSAPDAGAKAPRQSSSWYGSRPLRDGLAEGAASKEKGTQDGQPERKPSLGPSTPSKRAPSIHLSPAMSMRSQALTGTTKLNISSTGQESDDLESTKSAERSKSTSSKDSKAAQPSQDNASTTTRGDPSAPQPSQEDSRRTARKDPKPTEQAPPDPPKQADQNPSKSQTSQPFHQSQSTWASWFARSQTEATSPGTKPQATEADKSAAPVASKGRQPSAAKAADPIVSAPASEAPKASEPPAPKISEATKQSEASEPPAEAPARPRSWLGLWSGGKPNGTTAETAPKARPVSMPPPAPDKTPSVKGPASPEKQPEADTRSAKDVSTASDAVASSSSWAFWSRAPANSTQTTLGELAVAGSSSQSSPQRALDHEDGMPKALNSSQSRKRGRPGSLDGEEGRTSSAPPPQKKAADISSTRSVPGTPQQRPIRNEPTEANNLLLPLFKQTYPMEPEKATLLQQLGHLIYGKPSGARHPTLIRDPPRIKRALVIGIHGYFPTPLVQTILGRPTGTSIKFAEHAARAIHKYTQSQGYTPISVEKIALEGEGRIEERLDILWKLLLNWIEKIRHADFILLACHSQGVPVAISLAAKLIGFGCIHGARVGVCAMAGVNLGPFAEYKSRWIGGSAGELFEFARPDSTIARGYESALNTVLQFGGKVLYVGSMDDQLVSLQSSTFGSAQHPNIYRAVWIDGRVHISDFLTHLVGFALKVRNLGVSDHGLVRELSNPLAGSLVGGEGHSRIYEDPSVYDLAIEFTAGTTSINTERLKVDRNPSSTSLNPYILPFAVRGLLEEDIVRKELAVETVALIREFDAWKPSTKVLRDVKYRLEGVRSKL